MLVVVRVLTRVTLALLVPAVVLLGGAVACADPAGDAAAALAKAPLYISTDARSRGAELTLPALGDGVKIAVITDSEGNTGQVAAAILKDLTAAGAPVQTVAVIRFTGTGVDEFHAVSAAGAPFCRGGADLAARRALAGQQSGGVDLDSLVAGFTAQLAKLPPDRGESSCASAEAKPASDSGNAWLWWLIASVVGVAGIGAFALYSHRTVQARRAAGELPDEEEGFISVEYEDAGEDEDDEQS